MANIKISDLPSGGVLLTTDQIPVARGSTTNRVTLPTDLISGNIISPADNDTIVFQGTEFVNTPLVNEFNRYNDQDLSATYNVSITDNMSLLNNSFSGAATYNINSVSTSYPAGWSCCVLDDTTNGARILTLITASGTTPFTFEGLGGYYLVTASSISGVSNLYVRYIFPQDAYNASIGIKNSTNNIPTISVSTANIISVLATSSSSITVPLAYTYSSPTAYTAFVSIQETTNDFGLMCKTTSQTTNSVTVEVTNSNASASGAVRVSVLAINNYT